MSSPCGGLQVVRIGSFCFQARHCARQQNLVLDSVFTLCYSILSFTGVYVVLLLIDLVNDWLVRSSRKCQVGREAFTDCPRLLFDTLLVISYIIIIIIIISQSVPIFF